jgi:hypothetical protein
MDTIININTKYMPILYGYNIWATSGKYDGQHMVSMMDKIRFLLNPDFPLNFGLLNSWRVSTIPMELQLQILRIIVIKVCRKY